MNRDGKTMREEKRNPANKARAALILTGESELKVPRLSCLRLRILSRRPFR